MKEYYSKNSDFRINNIVFGENKPLLIGNIYTSQFITENYSNTLKILNNIEKLSKKLKLNHIYDIVVEDKKDLEKSLNIISELNNNPFLIDTSSQKIFDYSINMISKYDLVDRLIINSITLKIKNELLDTINKNKVRNAVILLFNPRINSIKSRLNVFEKINSKLANSSIENKLVDCVIIDISTIYKTILTMRRIKEEYNLPVGCAPSNASYVEKKKSPELLSKNFGSYDTTLNLIMRLYGADFLIYGSIKAYSRIFKSISLSQKIRYQLKKYQ